MAVVVALITPWIVNWLSNKPKLSKIKAIGTRVVDQTNYDHDETLREAYTLHVGRLVLKNEGEYTARSVEAYLERIVYEGEERKDFLPMPLSWTHGQLNKDGITVRDIYPNQAVYLDVFNHFFNPYIVGDRETKFAVGTGENFENLSYVNTGKSDVYIKFYQESGQVNTVHLISNWDNGVPELSIV